MTNDRIRWVVKRFWWVIPVAFIAGITVWQILSVTPPGLKCPVPGSGPNGIALYGVPPYGCTGPVHWVLHGLGVDSQIGYFYDFASGSGPMFLTLLVSLSVIGTAVAAYRRWSCQQSFWCMRHGHYPLTDPDTHETRNYCWKHHPGVSRKHWDFAHIEDVWRRHTEHKQAATVDTEPATPGPVQPNA